jgi:hypothetical protein
MDSARRPRANAALALGPQCSTSVAARLRHRPPRTLAAGHRSLGLATPRAAPRRGAPSSRGGDLSARHARRRPTRRRVPGRRPRPRAPRTSLYPTTPSLSTPHRTARRHRSPTASAVRELGSHESRTPKQRSNTPTYASYTRRHPSPGGRNRTSRVRRLLPRSSATYPRLPRPRGVRYAPMPPSPQPPATRDEPAVRIEYPRASAGLLREAGPAACAETRPELHHCRSEGPRRQAPPPSTHAAPQLAARGTQRPPSRPRDALVVGAPCGRAWGRGRGSGR